MNFDQYQKTVFETHKKLLSDDESDSYEDYLDRHLELTIEVIWMIDGVINDRKICGVTPADQINMIRNIILQYARARDLPTGRIQKTEPETKVK